MGNDTLPPNSLNIFLFECLQITVYWWGLVKGEEYLFQNGNDLFLFLHYVYIMFHCKRVRATKQNHIHTYNAHICSSMRRDFFNLSTVWIHNCPINHFLSSFNPGNPLSQRKQKFSSSAESEARRNSGKWENTRVDHVPRRTLPANLPVLPTYVRGCLKTN